MKKKMGRKVVLRILGCYFFKMAPFFFSNLYRMLNCCIFYDINMFFCITLYVEKHFITINIFHIHCESKDNIGGLIRKDIIKYLPCSLFCIINDICLRNTKLIKYCILYSNFCFFFIEL